MANTARTTSPRDGFSRELVGNGHTSVVVYTVSSHDGGRDWAVRHRDLLREDLGAEGALVLRGLPIDLDAFHEVAETIGGPLLEYTERSTPRSSISGNIYTSTDYPADQTIPMHNENSYADSWPSTLYFLCRTAPGTGGATPIADSRAVFRQIPERLREKFSGGVLYTRAFRRRLGLSWQESFQTDDPAVVEEHCRRHGYEFEWTAYGLRTRHRRPAFLPEPGTGETVWFNQAHLFHVSNLEPEVREALLSMYAEADLPRNALYGDGTPIADEDLAEVTAIFDKTSIALPWQAGDLLVVNNMLVAHGRQSYTGERDIAVAMT